MDSVLPKVKADFNAKLRDVPHRPGVYLMRDRLNRVIYVGKARDLRKRLASYFMPSRRQTADLKTRALLESIWDFETHSVKSEPEALLLEGKLIKEYRPRYNISFRDDKRFLMVRVHPEDPIPRFQLTRLRKEDGARYFGPYTDVGAMRRARDAQLDARQVRSALVPPGGTHRLRLQALPRAGDQKMPGAVHRAHRAGGLPGARVAGV